VNRPKSDRYGVVVPIRSLATGKSRLLTTSDPIRSQLALAFFLDTVAALECSVLVDRIVVVSADTTIRHMVTGRCETVADDEIGLTSAIDVGVAHLCRTRHSGPVAVVLPDLPFATKSAFDSLLFAARGYQQAFLADVTSSGTTSVTARSADRVIHRFGTESARAHAEAGLVALDVPVPELRADVDVLDDLHRRKLLRLGPETSKVLDRWQISA
jgi:2-phospho-L-lactate guanylyltransferase